MGFEIGDVILHDLIAAVRLGNLRDEVSSKDTQISVSAYFNSLKEQEADLKIRGCVSLIYLLSEAVDMLVKQSKLDEKEFLSILELLEKDESIEIWGTCSKFSRHLLDNHILKTKYKCKNCGHQNHETKTECVYCGLHL